MKSSLYISLLACLLCFFPGTQLTAQDSSRLRISLLTCTPGDELYSIFGHSALRVVDSNSVTDIVFNYGTFNFDDEGFYIKFIRGKLPYYISTETFPDFKYIYQSTNRGMTEQVLALTAAEKINIYHYLRENLKEENKYYQYDFFLDNCTTRLRDIIVKNKQPIPMLPAVMPTDTRFREAIHQYLDNGRQYWSKLGIDILLGAPTDAMMSASQQQFLPDNLMLALNRSTPQTVLHSNNLYALPIVEAGRSLFTPMVCFSLMLLLFVLLDISRNKLAKAILNGLDGSLFFLVGLLGIVLIFMWTGTDHTMTKNNYNLLWAWPTHLVASFLISSSNVYIKRYFLFSALGYTCMLLTWFFLPQQMNPALIPVVLLIIYRSATKYFEP